MVVAGSREAGPSAVWTSMVVAGSRAAGPSAVWTSVVVAGSREAGPSAVWTSVVVAGSRAATVPCATTTLPRWLLGGVRAPRMPKLLAGALLRRVVGIKLEGIRGEDFADVAPQNVENSFHFS